ncbi:MAG: response regulator, partial [Alphaproteobacteria bacterium]|nr:response regulator [Alphaproteobacteria bacterium]
MTCALIVDDSRLARRISRSMLEACGVEVDEAEASASGLARCAEKIYDFVMVDYYVSETSGLDMIRNLRRKQEYKDIPIILCAK